MQKRFVAIREAFAERHGPGQDGCLCDRLPEPRACPLRVAHAGLRQSSRLECLDRAVGKRGQLARQQAALRALDGSGATLAKLTEAFLTAPIHSRAATSPTVYTAVYRPGASTVDYVWPGHVMTQQIGSFRPGQYVHDYGALTTCHCDDRAAIV